VYVRQLRKSGDSSGYVAFKRDASVLAESHTEAAATKEACLDVLPNAGAPGRAACGG
jgi:hypothetical protein